MASVASFLWVHERKQNWATDRVARRVQIWEEIWRECSEFIRLEQGMKREVELRLGMKTESKDEEYLADSAWEGKTVQKNQDLHLF